MAARERRGMRLRRPSLGEVVGLLVAEGVVLVLGAAAVGLVGWSPLRGVVAGVVLLVLVRWVAALRSSWVGVHWGDGASPGHGSAWHHPYTGSGGLADFSGSAGGGGDGGGC